MWGRRGVLECRGVLIARETSPGERRVGPGGDPGLALQERELRLTCGRVSLSCFNDSSATEARSVTGWRPASVGTRLGVMARGEARTHASVTCFGATLELKTHAEPPGAAETRNGTQRSGTTRSSHEEAPPTHWEPSVAATHSSLSPPGVVKVSETPHCHRFLNPVPHETALREALLRGELVGGIGARAWRHLEGRSLLPEDDKHSLALGSSRTGRVTGNRSGRSQATTTEVALELSITRAGDGIVCSNARLP
ncbi:hypothetical protein E2C01_006050 [Portunus trituberculatus]|uniref:Uncharacterized protein n=1 Tax=Portunus trituberculatus TaxID=210409 RepID=A0A5B7CVB5_PORTR|nr:hypothetical protein [Portunus trituberculatus]